MSLLVQNCKSTSRVGWSLPSRRAAPRPSRPVGRIRRSPRSGAGSAAPVRGEGHPSPVRCDGARTDYRRGTTCSGKRACADLSEQVQGGGGLGELGVCLTLAGEMGPLRFREQLRLRRRKDAAIPATGFCRDLQPGRSRLSLTGSPRIRPPVRVRNKNTPFQWIRIRPGASSACPKCLACSLL